MDPFIGTAATHLPPASGLAATWWFPKPQVGNTHPGATSPLGMVSACAYSGAYPTGYFETFGIALTEKLLAGGGPVITTPTGGTGEAVGDAAVVVGAGDVAALAAALDRVVLEMSEHERRLLERRGREHAAAFERTRMFDDLFRPAGPPAEDDRVMIGWGGLPDR
ncbi:glycosyltransferase [Pseudonocardia lacus]|uniref:glycosyltransferase n=1 Tax=Pseudonocardia lacus TaxID=2835865 RepID=UPI001BDBDCA8|nr:glycosyltransferase [Pseudonocardia lacus]